MLSHMTDTRKHLIAKGIGEEYLPVPEWLTSTNEDEIDPTGGPVK
jgi:hypothetical protein